MKKIIYLDNAATTQVYKEVSKEIEKFLTDEYGNPSSSHFLGENALVAINKARKKLASEIGAQAQEIVFTSGGTESNNLVLQGIMPSKIGKNKIIISAIEHSSVYEVALYLRTLKYDVFKIPVNKEGRIDITQLEKNLDGKTFLVSVIHANNEIGVIQDISAIGKLCRKRGILFHTDAVQSFGKEKINVNEMCIDLLSASAHKIGGPKGTGFLYIKNGVKIQPLIIGGEQERGLRSGTENVAGILGFAKALEITKKTDKTKIKNLRDYFIQLLERLDGKINGSKDFRIYNNIHVSFSSIDAEILSLTLAQKGIICSTKSACLNKQEKESKVLKAIGLNDENTRGSLRFVLNEFITRKDVDFVIKKIEKFLREQKNKT